MSSDDYYKVYNILHFRPFNMMWITNFKIGASVIKHFNSSIKLFELKIYIVKLKSSLVSGYL